MEEEDRYIGWVSIHRKILKHWIIGDPHYFSAWIVMLLEVNHDREVKKKIIKKQVVECGRGQSIKSIDTWATVFGSKHWTRQKVRTFFRLLEKDGMINQENLSVTTRLTICNFDTYQKKQPSDNQQSNHHVTISQPSDNHHITTNNNGNNGNNANNEEYIPPNPLEGGTAGDASQTESFQLDADQQQPASKPKAKRERKPAQDMPEIPEALDTPAFRSAWTDFVEHRKSIRKPMSPKAAQLNLNTCINLGHENAILAIEQSIANGWTGIFEPKNTTPGVNGSKPKRDPRVPAHIPDEQAQMWILHQETNCYAHIFGDRNDHKDVD